MATQTPKIIKIMQKSQILNHKIAKETILKLKSAKKHSSSNNIIKVFLLLLQRNQDLAER
jgi:hypothetical protein